MFASIITGSSSSSTFGILLSRASGNNVPTSPLQQFGRTEAGTCEQQPADLLDFPGVSHLNGQSWGPSWAQWPNGGTGGFVCNRQPYYTNNGSWAVE